MHAMLRKLSENQFLTRSEAAEAMTLMLNDACSTEQISGFLLGLRSRKESLDELVGLTQAMREQCVPVTLPDPKSIDIVGTGGDGLSTFNISTTAALVCAGAGVSVAKHGNRSVSSKCGSADVLEALGVATELDADQIETCLREAGIAFMFAPVFHTALRHVMPVRRALGVRTCFNILGPLCNPAGVTRHFIGAFSESMAETMAHILKDLGSTHIVAVHSEDGMDEISISAPTTLFRMASDRSGIEKVTITPEQFGFERADLGEIIGGDAIANAAIVTDVLHDKPGPARDIVVLNAATALYAAGDVESIQSGVENAKLSISDGGAAAALKRLADVTQDIRRASR
jgi:anthranilate phosphoribosyltransferase